MFRKEGSLFNKVTCHFDNLLKLSNLSFTEDNLQRISSKFETGHQSHAHLSFLEPTSTHIFVEVSPKHFVALCSYPFLKQSSSNCKWGRKGEDRNGKDIPLLPTLPAEILPTQNIKCPILKCNFVSVFTRPFLQCIMKGFRAFLSLSDQNAIPPPAALALFVVNCFSININIQMSSLWHYISCAI